MVKFIQISDLHLVPTGSRLYGLDPGERLARCIESLLAAHADAVCCVATGDLVNDHPAESYRLLAEQFARLPMPVHPILGNHDSREHFRAAFPQVGTDEHGFVQYEAQIGAQRAIFLDTHEPGAEHGVYCAKRASWLAARLAADDRPVLLFMHHPPMAIGIPGIDRLRLLDPGPLLAALAGHERRVRHLFFGHVHRAVSGSWLGIPCSSLHGTNHQVALCLQDTGTDVMGSREPPQYAVVLIGDDSVTVHLHDFLDTGGLFAL